MLPHDAFRIANEVDDIAYLVAHGHLVFNLLQGILYAEVALVYQTVGVHDVSQDTLGHHVLVLQYHGVYAVVFGGISGRTAGVTDREGSFNYINNLSFCGPSVVKRTALFVVPPAVPMRSVSASRI